jgi:NADH:ubiquinone oxidoreductase subunit C
MSLLLPKTFGASIKESEILNIMKLSSQSLMAQQKTNQEKIAKIYQVIEFQKKEKARVITRLDRYDAELAETEQIKEELLGKTIARQ